MNRESADVVDTDDDQRSTEATSQKKEEYVPGWTIDRVSITRQEYGQLRPGEWLDDTLLDYFLRFITGYVLDHAQSKRYFLFSSLFFTSLNSDKHLHEAYDRVKRWTKSLAKPIWEYDYIFVPIHEETHWYLAIICNPEVALKESHRPHRSQIDWKNSAHIICLDSGNSAADDKVRQKLVGYMHMEYRDKVGLSGNSKVSHARLDEWSTKWNWVPQGKCPQQENGFDCGVFLLEYISYLARNESSFWEHLCPMSSRPLRGEKKPGLRMWFTQKDITHRRTKMSAMLHYMESNPNWAVNTSDREMLRDMFLSHIDSLCSPKMSLAALEASHSTLKQIISDTSSQSPPKEGSGRLEEDAVARGHSTTCETPGALSLPPPLNETEAAGALFRTDKGRGTTPPVDLAGHRFSMEPGFRDSPVVEKSVIEAQKRQRKKKERGHLPTAGASVG